MIKKANLSFKFSQFLFNVDSYHLHPCAFMKIESAGFVVVDLRKNWWEFIKTFLVPNSKLPTGMTLAWITEKNVWVTQLYWQKEEREDSYSCQQACRESVKSLNHTHTDKLLPMVTNVWTLKSVAARLERQMQFKTWVLESARSRFKLRLTFTYSVISRMLSKRLLASSCVKRG